jgi:acyl-CoA thioester hydrolase
MERDQPSGALPIRDGGERGLVPRAAKIRVVVRHEIDYLGNLKEGESVAARTWVADKAEGAKFDRYVEFSRNGRTIVRAMTTWAILDRVKLRPIRVPKDVVERFARIVG